MYLHDRKQMAMTQPIVGSLAVFAVSVLCAHLGLWSKLNRNLSTTIVLRSLMLGFSFGYILVPILLLLRGYPRGQTLSIQGLPPGLSQEALILGFLVGGVVVMLGRVWDYLELWRA